jgi:hypothetical protein
MAVFINGISGIILPSGAANAPIIRGDDPDTGIFFPASGQVAITVNGTNQVTFTSTGASFTGNISFSGSPVLTRKPSPTLRSSARSLRTCSPSPMGQRLKSTPGMAVSN